MTPSVGPTGELARKVIHVGATAASAMVVMLLPPLHAATVLAAATATALSIEVLRLANARVQARFGAALGPMLRDREHRRMTGATTLALGYTVAAVAVPGLPAAAGILVAGVGDAAGAVVGRRWGRRRYRGGKSLEGSAAFLAVALGLGWLLGLSLTIAFLLAAALTILEALTLPLDDNLYLPTLAAIGFAVLAG